MGSAKVERGHRWSYRKKVGGVNARRYLSKLRRDSVGSDFQSVYKLTNYVCVKPPESYLSVFSNTYKHFSEICIAKIADIEIT